MLGEFIAGAIGGALFGSHHYYSSDDSYPTLPRISGEIKISIINEKDIDPFPKLDKESLAKRGIEFDFEKYKSQFF